VAASGEQPTRSAVICCSCSHTYTYTYTPAVLAPTESPASPPLLLLSWLPAAGCLLSRAKQFAGG
jgi:hypothetical protein